MAQDCPLRTPEDFVFPLLPNEELRDKYRRYLFRDYVEVCPAAALPGLPEPPSHQMLTSYSTEEAARRCFPSEGRAAQLLKSLKTLEY